MTDSADTFEGLGLDPRILSTLAGLGFEAPTPIQAAAIPPLLKGRNIVGRARTGSGKTAAFGLPIIERMVGPSAGGRGVRALVLAPTRELAIQVTDAIRSFARGLPVRLVTIYGGSSYRPQFEALSRGVPVVVGTPGRLIDHLERGTLDLSGVEMVVVDEADEMLRMGFIDDVERLLGATPATRQTALFSATMPGPIRRVADKFLDNALSVQVEAEAGPTTHHIEQRFMRVPDRHKPDALARLLRAERREAALVFVRTRRSCAELAEILMRQGIEADALHGDLAQTARETVLRRLRARRIDCVIATDVAARGIDVEHITHVVNVDLPENADGYAHRIGRTGRAGRAGVAISFVTPREQRRFFELVKRLGARVAEARPPSVAEIARRQRTILWDELRGSVEDDAQAHTLNWVEELVASSDWSPHDIAAAALGMLATQRGLDLRSDLDDRPPAWAHARGGERGGGDGRPPRGGPRSPRGPRVEQVEVFLPVGARNGIRPGDLVGAFANELGVPGQAIGRITIAERKSFVALDKAVAGRLIEEGPSLTLRGKVVRVAQARTGGPPSTPPADGDSPPPRRPKAGPKKGKWKKAAGKGKPKAKGKGKSKGKPKGEPKGKPKGEPKGEGGPPKP